MKNRNGFTLIELLAVIVILGILAMITVPIVSNYLSDTRQRTYTAHETTMVEAAKSLTVECINGTETCDLPRVGNSTDIYLNELIDKDFSQRLQNPQGSGYCNENLSYVTVTKLADGNYDYKACLYCGNYVTEGVCSPVTESGDTAAPTCGTITGESSEWTNMPRVITVACNDTGGSGCTRTQFSKTFKDTAVNGEILISDRAGNTKRCPVSVKVDTTAPTCELEVVGATYETNGWYSGPVKVRFKSGSISDSESGKSTWGIGTSSETPDYNREEEINLKDINGVVTVFGYVKDNAGNEGTCSKNLRLGIQRPDFDIYYGYQIFPLKEDYSTSNITVTSNNVLKTTSTNPTLTFSGMSKYTNATKVIITTTNTITDPTTYKLTIGSTVYSPKPSNGNKRLEFDITKGSYGTYTFKMGNVSGVTNTVSRIEIQQTKNNLPTNKEVTVNLHPVIEREKVKTNGYSFNDGTSFQTDYFKSFIVTNGEVNGVAQTKNDIPMYSDKKNYKITSGDSSGPTISVTKSPESWTNQDVTLTGKGQDSASGIVAFGFSKSSSLPYVSSSWQTITLTKNEITKTDPASTIGTYYFNLKDEAGNISNKSIVVDNIDKVKPVCNVTSNSTVNCTDSGDSDNGVSSISCYIYGKDATKSSTCKSVTATNSLSTTVTVNSAGTWNLYAKDRAGNISDKKSYNYYTVTYNKNGGDSCTLSSEIIRENTNATLSPTCIRTGYTFRGWSDSSSGGVISSKKVTANVTLYAVWQVNVYNISYEYNSGSAPSSGVPSTYTYGVGATINGKPTRSNYTFNGWSFNSSLTSPAFTKTIGTTETGNKTLYAKWCRNCASVSHGSCTLTATTAGTCSYSTSCNSGYTISGNGTYNPTCTPNTYTVTYNKGSGTGNNQTQSVTYNAEWTTKGAIFTKTGYVQTGWSTTNGGSKTHSLNTNQGTYTKTGNLTLYAVYEEEVYNIYYVYNGGSAPSSGVPSTYKYGTGATINGRPSRSSYTFNGWSFNSSLTSPAFTKTIGTTESGDKTLYAKWCRDCSPSGGASCSLNASTAGTCTYTTSCPTGYNISGNGTYSPSCTPITYTVTYYANNGTSETRTTSVSGGSSWTTLGKVFTRAGAILRGWSTSSTGNVTHSLSTSQSPITSNLKLYAVWSEPYCKIKLGHIVDDGHNADQLIQVMTVCGWYNGVRYPWEGGYGARTNAYKVPKSAAVSTVNGCFRDRTNEVPVLDPNVPWLHWLEIECDDGSDMVFQRDHGVKNFSQIS